MKGYVNPKKYELSTDKLVAEDKTDIKEKLSTSPFGTDLPQEIVELIVEYRGRAMRWGLCGPNIILIDEQGSTIYQSLSAPNSAIANSFFESGSGTHVWEIHVVESVSVSDSRCIGVLNSKHIDQHHLNGNLQENCHGRRIVFDGPSSVVYNDFDRGLSGETRAEITWKTGDKVTVYLCCNERLVRFAILGDMRKNIRWSRLLAVGHLLARHIPLSGALGVIKSHFQKLKMNKDNFSKTTTTSNKKIEKKPLQQNKSHSKLITKIINKTYQKLTQNRQQQVKKKILSFNLIFKISKKNK
ncbi:hypothetical protein RFI_39200 [Reticulomyxa filosa]|uniref:B30.2/SPRY domain-containing protein n=1 Tax=Reticulomyxa filosa TaxID=46433 RepID=X6LC47_RETFI|nr:hypothetical protein RFI_39200 [Reticulomyxa filosa]|eukprot:ETN98309.1 hypothetical protein RFI_39200 [Reticulomyxa filosa]